MNQDHQIIYDKLCELIGKDSVFYDKTTQTICFYPMTSPFSGARLHSTMSDIINMGQAIVNKLPQEYTNELVKILKMELFYFKINKNDKNVAIVKICY